MKGRAIIPMVVGLGVGFVALKIFVNVLQNAKASTTSELVPVVYAATNIEPTLEIQESMIEIRHVSKEAFPETGFKDKSEVVGRVTMYPVPKGTPIAAMLLAPKGTPPGMAVMIEEGYRAVAVKIDESAGVAGWIKPGSRVDVIVLLSNPDRSQGNQSFSKVILQNVEVLAVGQELGKAGDTAATVTKTVTLKVTPEDVPTLHLAETKGKLRLAMRGQNDKSVAQEKVTTDNDLLGRGLAGLTGLKKPRNSVVESFLAAQAKVTPLQTDKDNQPGRQSTTEPQTWTVEVLKGPQEVETVSFQRGQAKQWQRVGEPERLSAPAPRPAKAQQPVSLFAPVPGSPADAANSTEPQAMGPVAGGPSGTW
ncbi:MAG TPA: Flp pilus assembly protein CpaB [Phycisphaerae bacterium]|nr:Flp pilus assembly protein CpaB [Phycisphaerae bacterium]HOJ74078.1 Flp pilus assembly protein CpaB [Phycisphaerae bacterium]HOM50673.1 Flp pilus assembly protein CpaB [Phycisphaerae bacterium]HON67565.1 Flp pilus assembly protein CpaB [Phycisphaerae bacterium]HOQ85095.1 Flp pilus assembly protein CpaB [Phycisphaerae bacterium]